MTHDSAVIEEGMLSTERIDLYHLRIKRPDAPKVLLLGGSNFDLRLKRAFLNSPLALNCDLSTYEPRGIGRTQHPTGPWTMQDYARDALAALDALGWSDAIVVGESFGGMTALHLALLAPERVCRMVIASATAGGPEHASYDIARFLDLPLEDAAREALCLQDTRNAALRQHDPEAFAQKVSERMTFETAFRDPSLTSGGYPRLLEARRAHDCTARLDKITVPTTVIAGRFDTQARPEAQKALADALPNSSFHLFDAGHGVLFTDPTATQTAYHAIETATLDYDDQESA